MSGTTRRIIKKRTVKGFWNCKYCGTTKIDGLVDYCPNCGVHKPTGTKHDVDKNNIVEVSKEELKAAGIVHSEDGTKRPEWSCKHCDSMNNWLDDVCHSCGAPKEDRPTENPVDCMYDSTYFEDEEDDKPKYSPVVDNMYESTYFEENNTDENDLCSKDKFSLSKLCSNIGNFLLNNIKGISIITFVLCILGLITYLLYPIKESTAVDNLSWERAIEIEELRTFSESDWSLPSGARLKSQKEELYDIETVIDYYKEVEVQKSREELVGYEEIEIVETRREIVDYEISYETEYEDNGDGTYDEYTIEVREPVYDDVEYTRTVKEPIYETVYYTEIEKEPVYKDVEIYKTKYYYDIDRWVTDYYSRSSGNDKNPYWNESYTLSEKEREGSRTQSYSISYDNGKSLNVPYDEWMNTNIGDEVTITTCKLGIIYNQTKVIE